MFKFRRDKKVEQSEVRDYEGTVPKHPRPGLKNISFYRCVSCGNMIAVSTYSNTDRIMVCRFCGGKELHIYVDKGW